MPDSGSGGKFTYQFDVDGMTCAACVANVEKAIARIPGVSDIAVNLATESATVQSNQAISIDQLSRSVKKMGYRISAQGSTSLIHRQQRMIWGWQRLLLIQAAFGVPLLIYSMAEMFHLLPGVSPRFNILFQLGLASILILSGNGYYIRGAKHLWQRVPNMDSLVALGTGSAYVYSLISSANLWFDLHLQNFTTLYFEAAGTILLFITLGKWLEAKARGRTTEALTGLMEQMPKSAEVWRGGSWQVLPLEAVVKGDRVRVSPHSRLPVDGIILKGLSSVDESSITGESLPVERTVSDKVIGASMNLQSTLEIEATMIGRDSIFGQVIQLVERAQTKKPEIQKLVDRIASVFVPSVLVIAMGSAAVWLLLGYGFTFALNVMISVMIIACPCALGLATPTALVVSSGMAAKAGILIKSADAFQQLAKVDTVVLDKTGTLTQGKIRVAGVYPESGDWLNYAASLEAQSNHPLGKAVQRFAAERQLEPLEFDHIEETPGKGIWGRLGDSDYRVAALEQIEYLPTDMETAFEKYIENGFTISGLYHNEDLTGLLAFSDTVREDAQLLIKKLQAASLRTVLITGDRARPAEALARSLGISEVQSQVLPAEKHRLVEQLQQAGHCVAMIGDGINDAPALVAADVGLAFREGTDIAMNSADIILMNNMLINLDHARRLAKATMSKIKQNLFWAFFYNLIGIPVAMGVLYPFTGALLNPMFAGMAMAFSSVSVVSNTLVLRRFKA